MEFRLEFTPKPFVQKITHRHKLFLIGSCFTENIGSKLRQLKFDVLENPNGILFNPASIATALDSYIHNTLYSEADLFYQNECWNSWQHHSRFSHPDKLQCLQGINQSQACAHVFLKQAHWLFITVGSAFVYQLQQGTMVANCHKVPLDKFEKKLLHPGEVYNMLHRTVQDIFEFNPALKIIFTISPVRHLRDGFVENNRSKATLIQAIHQLVDENEKLFYFPAYELVIDDLRDYRFYAEDMVHPNYAATNYVWEKFTTTCMDEPTQQLMKELQVIHAAKNHKPFNAASDAHKKFLQVNWNKVQLLHQQYPHINFEEELAYFGG
ncbi:MAG TPA: GSCFA domain-containing protein [Ferruginibacter sp.]|nr:GSCFA domain-containing protein [Ferruginibacter sp.]HMP20477.1 GSCFA domain-containing protein [Ferruginibacter sp.]